MKSTALKLILCCILYYANNITFPMTLFTDVLDVLSNDHTIAINTFRKNNWEICREEKITCDMSQAVCEEFTFMKRGIL